MPRSSTDSSAPPRLDDDGRVGRGERGRVVEQLGDQVDHVVDGVRRHLDVPVDDAELDPGVVLDLGLGGPEHVDQGGRLALHAGRVGAGENQEVFVVPPHPGGQVVELEELGQPVRVFLATLQAVQVTDEPVDQDLGTTGQVHEHRRDGRPEGGLLGGGADGLEVDRVERLGHLTELVPAAHR